MLQQKIEKKKKKIENKQVTLFNFFFSFAKIQSLREFNAKKTIRWFSFYEAELKSNTF